MADERDLHPVYQYAQELQKLARDPANKQGSDAEKKAAEMLTYHLRQELNRLDITAAGHPQTPEERNYIESLCGKLIQMYGPQLAGAPQEHKRSGGWLTDLLARATREEEAGSCKT